MSQNRAIIKSVLTNRKDENEMKITMMPVVYDDENNECRIGDTILVRTTRITTIKIFFFITYSPLIVNYILPRHGHLVNICEVFWKQ